MTDAILLVSAKLGIPATGTLRAERASFGAKVRVARAVTGLSQDELAERVGLTQKSVHRIEQGSVEPRLRTVLVINQFWREQGIGFEDLPDGGFRVLVGGTALRR